MDELTSFQISEWEAYDRIDPIGTWRDDFRMAYMSSLITNLTISVHGKKNTKHTDIMDFMPRWDNVGDEKQIKKQSLDDMKKALIDIASSQNKKEARKKANVSRPPTNLKSKK